MAECRGCGTDLQPVWKFCIHCGTPVAPAGGTTGITPGETAIQDRSSAAPLPTTPTVREGPTPPQPAPIDEIHAEIPPAPRVPPAPQLPPATRIPSAIRPQFDDVYVPSDDGTPTSVSPKFDLPLVLGIAIGIFGVAAMAVAFVILVGGT